MNNILTTLSFLFWVIIFYTIYRSSRSSVDHYKKPYRLIKENKHGHRCYLEGLSYSERAVVDTLAHSLDSKRYFIFNNLIIPTSTGSSTQIDHLVVSPYGIFVIESKDYSGWIFGSYSNKQWTQCLPGGKKYYFQNPLHQNFGHIKQLASYLSFIPEELLISVISFSQGSDFKTTLPRNVLHTEELPKFILDNKDIKLSEQQVMLAIGKISYLCQAIDITTEQHIENVKQLLSQ